MDVYSVRCSIAQDWCWVRDRVFFFFFREEWLFRDESIFHSTHVEIHVFHSISHVYNVY